MCGIVGVVGPNAGQYIQKLTDIIAHRGPDDAGIFNTDRLAFGHRRLSILDLSPNGHQPMLSADGRYVMVFNGEIYNHTQIRAEFSDKYTFKSSSDTETILYGFAEYGPQIFERLNGIFALAIFDTLTQTLTLARDQFGIKPLYYYHQNGQFIFGSEIKSIAAFPGINKSLDYTALVNYLHFLWSPAAQTPFEHVRKLLPGHYAQLNVQDPQKLTFTKYYEIPFAGKYTHNTEAELIDELDARLYRAVERQLLSDRPLGFFLSGGLDSSAIVAMAKRISPGVRWPCYTIKTGDADGDFEGFANDLPFARKVAKYLDVELIEVQAQADIVRDFDLMIWHLDEPQADTAPLNVLNICQQARANDHIVLLGGTAGDDVFSGYRRHQAMRYEPILGLIPRSVGRILHTMAGLLGTQNATARRIQKVASGLALGQKQRMASYLGWLPLQTNKNLFSDRVRALIGDYDPSQVLIDCLKDIPQEKNLLNQMLFWDLKYFLTDHNLNYTDKLSMATGVEVRVPFLDLELVEFSTLIPPHLKLKGTTTKYLLKKVMERYLPHDVIYRPKTGFGAPLREWFGAGKLDDMTAAYLSVEGIQKRGIFNADAVQELVKSNRSGKIDASYTVWGLMAVESWMRQFIDNTTHEPAE